MWIRLLGGEAGSGVETAVCELRICMAILWTARRLEWSYREKSGLGFMACVYWLLAVVSSNALYALRS